MPDVDGNPDTEEMYDHWNVEKIAAAAMMNQAHVLGRFSTDFTPAAKAKRVAVFKAAHPGCTICAQFAGNPPVFKENND